MEVMRSPRDTVVEEKLHDMKMCERHPFLMGRRATVSILSTWWLSEVQRRLPIDSVLFPIEFYRSRLTSFIKKCDSLWGAGRPCNFL